jgi:DNA-binding HxlR family transcriptional regulator
VEPASGTAAANVFEPNCPSRVLLDHVTSRWAVLVLVALSRETMRWGELRRELRGVTDKMLAQTLHTLEADGLVSRKAHPEVPPRVEYSLTADGRDLATKLLPLVDWVTSRALEHAAGSRNESPDRA